MNLITEGQLPAMQSGKMYTSNVHKVQSSHLCHFQHKFYKAGMWNPFHNIIHIVPEKE